MKTTSGIRRRKAPPQEVVVVVDARPEQAMVHYEENLLERARIQWQFGDWNSLIKLDRDALQHHPDRAKLALLAAAGQFQAGDFDLARQFIRLAYDWGCSDKLLMQILSAGVHNSLGRAAAHAGDGTRALQHFECSILLGAGGTDVRLMLQARANEQFAQLSLKVPENRRAALDQKDGDARIDFTTGPTFRKSPISLELFFSKRKGARARALREIRKSIDDLSPAGSPAEIAWVSTEHRGKEFFFTHFVGDYIPGKMAEKKQFYESPFLNLLARLHQPRKLIVDGGANIGNHTIFFAGVIGAQVIAFEPQPFNSAFLVANVHLNRLESKVDIRKIALGAQPGRASLVQAMSGNHGSYTADAALVKRNDGDPQPVVAFDVDVSTLDAELAHYDNAISIIKLDLEGMELDALRGATSIIAKNLPVIAVECFTRSMYQRIKEFLSAFDYFVIDSTNATPTFIFLTRKSPHHVEILSRYLEMSLVGKFAANAAFNESKT